MKILILLLLFVSGHTAYATVDVQGEAYIVVEDVHQDDAYDLRKVPVEYCAGIPALTLPQAVTKPVIIKSNYGCGHSGAMVFDQQINAATCVAVNANEVANADGSYNPRTVSISVDMSNCESKALSDNFQRAVSNAIHKTLNLNGYQVTSYTSK